METKKIVVIDDCRLTLAMASDMLLGEGYEVATAETGLAANPLIYSKPAPDLIIIDVEMPLLNGDRKVQLLKKLPASQNIPVLLMSGKKDENLEALVGNCGADDYLCKPLSPESFLPKVAKLLTSQG